MADRIQLEQDNGFRLDVIPFGSTAVRPPALEALETTLVVTEVRDDEGLITALRSFFLLEADPDFSLTEESVPGIYNVRERFPGTYILDTDGTGWFVSFGTVSPGDPPPDQPPNVNWEITDSGDLLVFRNNGFLKTVSTPFRESPNGFFSIGRFGFTGDPDDPENYGGGLLFWERVSP